MLVCVLCAHMNKSSRVQRIVLWSLESSVNHFSHSAVKKSKRRIPSGWSKKGSLIGKGGRSWI